MLQTARSKNSSSCKNGDKEKIKQKHKKYNVFPPRSRHVLLEKMWHPPTPTASKVDAVVQQ